MIAPPAIIPGEFRVEGFGVSGALTSEFLLYKQDLMGMVLRGLVYRIINSFIHTGGSAMRIEDADLLYDARNISLD